MHISNYSPAALRPSPLWEAMRGLLLFLLTFTLFPFLARANQPDSVYLFAYNAHPTQGLAMAYSADAQSWTSIGGGYNFVKSDYSAWGSEKKMHSPWLTRRAGEWVLVFALNDRVNQFAVCTSPDLVHWKPQDYPFMDGVGQCMEPYATVSDDAINVYFHNKEGQWYATATRDCYHFSQPITTAQPADSRVKAVVNNVEQQGTMHRVAWAEVDYIINYQLAADARSRLNSETLRDDASHFVALGPDTIKASVSIDAAAPKAISDKLIGIFFEDINYSADGGLYAELIQNRDFEYNNADHGREANWGPEQSWQLVGDGATFSISTDSPLNDVQQHYAVLDVQTTGAALENDGFDGIVVKRGERYDISLFARSLSGRGGKLKVMLCEAGKVVASTTLKAPTADWTQLSGVLRADADATNATLRIEPMAAGQYALDFVSLFPQDTYKQRKNGLRRDLAEALAELHPRFMRFPGGCLVHGNGLDNMYHWKESIGPLWERKPQGNLWGYHQTRGLGYFEFFQMCEDLGCEPLPVVAAGVPCQNTSIGQNGGGQQGGIPVGAPMQQYIQDVLDLIEWANGDPKTSEWARKRAEAGHPKPFNLKYLGIGNEDLISETFAERYVMIVDAVKQRYPDIIVCGTTGPFYEGSDYQRGWQLAKQHHIDMVDEHYYVSPGWYIHNQDFYDNYDRSASRVYLGEYASHGAGRKSTIETALTCAMHICNLERNGDIVAMSSYAPLLAKYSHTQWNPDLIYFDNTQVYPTVDYQVQRLCGQSQGNQYMPSVIRADVRHADVPSRLAVSTVRDTTTGRIYIKLVNLLPNALQANLDLNAIAAALGLDASQTSIPATITQLAGAWNDDEARPLQPEHTALSRNASLVVPPYSFTVIEL